MSEETRKITCIMCPRGCKVKVTLEDDEIKEVTGYACSNGKEYAIEEVKSPSRTVMSVIKCENAEIPTVSVKTSKPIPKEKIRDTMKSISDLSAECPVRIGDTILENVAGTDADIVATRLAEKASN